MYADTNEVAANLGRPLTVAEQAQAQVWIGWAEGAIAQRMGDLELIEFDVLNMVIVEAVTRRLRSPEPVTQVDIQVDDGRVSKRYERSSGLIEILPEWWARLGWTDSSGAFSVTPYTPAITVPDAWR